MARSGQAASPVLGQVKSRGLPEQIADAIVEGIASGALSPGQRLIELDLASRFAVSRVPLREALKTLEAQGIVERAPNRGVHIVELDDVRIDRVCELRAALETIAARSAVKAYRADPACLRAIDAAITKLAAAVKRGDWPAVNKADLAFHHEICLASKNDILITLWQGLARHVWMIFGREILNRKGRIQIVQQHRDLIAALLVASDGEIASLIEHHIMRLRRPLR